MTMMMKKRHVLQPITTKPLLPTQQGDENDSSGHQGQKQKQKPASTCFHTTRRSTRYYRHAILIVTIGTLSILGIFNPQDIIETAYDTLIKPSDQTLYGPPSNLKSKFLSKYEEMLTTDKGVAVKDLHFVPLLLENGKLLCRRRHKHKLSWFRARKFTEMIRMGLIQRKSNSSSISSNSTSTSGLSDTAIIEGGLPILLTEGDSLYCNVVAKRDYAPFPRLSWSIVAPKHGNWCRTIGIPSYKTWHYYHGTFKQQSAWISKFQQNDEQCPWSKKGSKAVWRGSTTYEGFQYTQSSLNETPRGQLVKKGMENPELIDAGFTRILDKFEKDEKLNEMRVPKGMSMSDMMKYKGESCVANLSLFTGNSSTYFKIDNPLPLPYYFFCSQAIIDIDGNNWSSRFGMLLCMNSVIIKVSILQFIDSIESHHHQVQANFLSDCDSAD